MSGSIGDSYARVVRSIYGSWWVLFGCLYTMAIGALLSLKGALIAQSLGLSGTSFEGLLLDLSLLVLAPFSALMWLHLRKHSRQQLKARELFLEQHDTDKLVTSRFGPLNIFKVCGERKGELNVEAVWNADGPVTDAKSHYATKADQFTDFDADAFLRR